MAHYRYNSTNRYTIDTGSTRSVLKEWPTEIWSFTMKYQQSFGWKRCSSSVPAIVFLKVSAYRSLTLCWLWMESILVLGHPIASPSISNRTPQPLISHPYNCPTCHVSNIPHLAPRTLRVGPYCMTLPTRVFAFCTCVSQQFPIQTFSSY